MASIAALESPLLAGAAVTAALAIFGIFVWFAGASPLVVYQAMYDGGFGSWFSIQNSLIRSVPIMLAALCTALPAWLGLVVIGGEGSLVLGALAAAVAASALAGAGGPVAWIAAALAGAAAGAALMAIVGWLRHARGVNETISSLLLTFLAIAVMNHLVEGPFRDPASLNKPSTLPLPDEIMLAAIPNTDIHWGFAVAVIACLAVAALGAFTTTGFAARVVGANPRAARLAGLRVGALMIGFCALGGAAAGLAGAIEVVAVQGACNASMVAGYGFTGILVAFLARHRPMAVIPVAILLGGIAASGGLLQRRCQLPDAAVSVLQGILFVTILAAESQRPRLAALLQRFTRQKG